MQRSEGVHVLPAGDGWAVEVDGLDQRDVFHTQDRAIKVARVLAWEHRRELLIHWTGQAFHPQPADREQPLGL